MSSWLPPVEVGTSTAVMLRRSLRPARTATTPCTLLSSRRNRAAAPFEVSPAAGPLTLETVSLRPPLKAQLAAARPTSAATLPAPRPAVEEEEAEGSGKRRRTKYSVADPFSFQLHRFHVILAAASLIHA